MKWFGVFFVIVALATAGHARAAETLSATSIPVDQAQKALRDIDSAPRFDFSKVVVLRMRDARGDRIEVVSLEPRIRKAAKGPATTAIAFNRDRTKITLVSIDGARAWRLEVPVNKLGVPGLKLEMPLLEPSGKVTPNSLAVSELISMP